MEPEQRYAHLKELAATIPDFGNRTRANNEPKVLEWLGRLYALLNDKIFGTDGINVKLSSETLGTALHENSERAIITSFYRAIAIVELSLPQSSRGSFIPAGNSYDAITALARIIGEASQTIMIVDPYMGSKTLANFVIQAKESVSISLLAAKKKIQPGFEPMVTSWVAQYATARPLAVRYVEPKTLHDRLIIVDNRIVWDISQSLEHLAARSPATISRADPETAQMKIEAYTAIFDQAVPYT